MNTTSRYLLIVSLLLNIGFGYNLVKYKSDNSILKKSILDTVQNIGSIESKILGLNKQNVQVTAYSPKSGQFANGRPVAAAISPVIERDYNIKLGDSVVLFEQGKPKILANIVDRTAQTETRPVVDLLFRNKNEAISFGRRNLMIAKISDKEKKEAKYVLVAMDARTWMWAKALFTRSMEEGLIQPEELPFATAYWLNMNKAIGYNLDKDSKEPKFVL